MKVDVPRNRKWTSEEDQIVITRYAKEGAAIRRELQNRSAHAVSCRAKVLGVRWAAFWTIEEDDILIALYNDEGPAVLGPLLGRDPDSAKNRARTLGLHCGRHVDGDREWTTSEIQTVRSRYPSEGAVKLAVDLDRSEASVRMCATARGIKVDRRRYRPFSQGRIGPDAKTFRGHGKVYGTYANRLKGRGRRCNVTAEYLNSIANERCPLSGRPLTYPSHSRDTTATASVDRIDSSKGYIKGNVQWIDKRVNWMKSNMTERELYEMCRDVAATLAPRYA